MCGFIFTNLKLDESTGFDRYLKPRGPDHTEIGEFNGCYYAHYLLSITGEFTPQPFFDNSRETIVLFNGEIYNYREFGDFKSDGECILPAFLEYGAELSQHLDGEYVIAIFTQKQAFIFTDPFKTKPLFYGRDDQSGWGFASYPSVLRAIGLTHIKNVAPEHHSFDLQQNVDSVQPWIEAFDSAVAKRAKHGVTKKVFMGLSSGYDSGAIAASLLKQDVDFQSYTVDGGKENEGVLQERGVILGDKFNHIPWSPIVALRARMRVMGMVEPFDFIIHQKGTNYRLPMEADSGNIKLHLVCQQAAADGAKIYLSGQGADEIISDYGHDGVKKFPHSCFGGKFPPDLGSIFPWKSFYGSTQSSYLMKEELIAGAYSLETRYPFLDKVVVQAFLNTTVEIKNSCYKSVIDRYLRAEKFPFCPGKKIGF